MHNNNKDSIRPPIQPRHALTLDVEKYQKMLDAPEMSDEQREDFLRALWNIVVAFVDLGFEIQPAEISCEQNAETNTQPQFGRDNLLYSSSDLPDQFVQSAAPQKGARHD